MSTRRSFWMSMIGALALSLTVPLAVQTATGVAPGLTPAETPTVAKESSETLAPEPGLVVVFNRPIVILRASRWILPRVVRAEQDVSERLVRSGFEVLSHVTTISGFLVRLAVGAIFGFCAYEWLAFCLQQFPYTRPWGKGLSAFLVSRCPDWPWGS